MSLRPGLRMDICSGIFPANFDSCTISSHNCIVYNPEKIPSVSCIARACGSNSSRHHHTASTTGLRTSRLRIRSAVYSLPSDFRNAFVLFQSWFSIITAFAAASFVSNDICFARCMAVKKDDRARSMSRSWDAKILRIRKREMEARRTPEFTCTGAAARVSIRSPRPLTWSTTPHAVAKTRERHPGVRMVWFLKKCNTWMLRRHRVVCSLSSSELVSIVGERTAESHPLLPALLDRSSGFQMTGVRYPMLVLARQTWSGLHSLVPQYCTEL